MQVFPGKAWQLGLIALVLPVYSFQLQTNYPIGSTYIWWAFMLTTIITLWSLRSSSDVQATQNHLIVLHLYLIWNVISIARGFKEAENYWDWKGLYYNGTTILLPLGAYLGADRAALRHFLSIYIKYTIPLFILWAPLMWKDAYGFYLALAPLILLAFPYLSFRWKSLFVTISAIVLSADLSARSNVIKFALPFFMLPYYKLRWIIPKSVIATAMLLTYALPVVLFILGVSGKFNIFKMDDYIKGDYVEVKQDAQGEVVEDNLKADTRTFLYEEVLGTAQKHNTWWLGRSPARGNETTWFADIAEITGRPERLTNEVAILNVFTWTGSIAVVLYGAIFLHASWLGLMKSSNSYIQLMALFVTFRWVYAWIEDYNIFTLNYLSIWIIIGMCLSKHFREMDDNKIRQWFQELFNFQSSKEAAQ